MSVICKDCGSECEAGTAVCPSCGAALEAGKAVKSETKKPARKGNISKRHWIRAEDRLSLYLLISGFTDGNVFYDGKSVYSELLVAVLPVVTYLFVFIHLGLDKVFLSYIGIPKLIFFILLSIPYGLGSVLLKSGVAVLSGVADSGKLSVDFINATRSVGLSYFVPAVIALAGVLVRFVFGWSSITFGLVTLLISLYPFLSLLSDRIKNKYITVAAVTAVGFFQCLAVSLLLFTKFF